MNEVPQRGAGISATGGGRALPRVVGFLVLAALVAVFALTRGPGAGGEPSLEVGVASLRQAIVVHDDACFSRAEYAFAQAAGGVVLDPYPMFLLQLARGLRTGHIEGAEPVVRAVIDALGRADWDGASRALDEVPADRAGRLWLVRAVADLRRKNTDQNCGVDPM